MISDYTAIISVVKDAVAVTVQGTASRILIEHFAIYIEDIYIHAFIFALKPGVLSVRKVMYRNGKASVTVTVAGQLK